MASDGMTDRARLEADELARPVRTAPPYVWRDHEWWCPRCDARDPHPHHPCRTPEGRHHIDCPGQDPTATDVEGRCIACREVVVHVGR